RRIAAVLRVELECVDHGIEHRLRLQRRTGVVEMDHVAAARLFHPRLVDVDHGVLSIRFCAATLSASCPGLSRASTCSSRKERNSWMAGTSPSMTEEGASAQMRAPAERAIE